MNWIPVEFDLPDQSKIYNITYEGKVGHYSDSAFFNEKINHGIGMKPKLKL